MSELVLQGLPTTSTRTSLAAFLAMAWPWPVKIFPLMPSKSLRSMPALRGTAPTSNAQFTPRKPSSRLDVGTMPLSNGKAQSSSSITTPPRAAIAFSSGISMRCKMTGCSGPNIAPEAMRNRSEYPIWPAAPVIATRRGALLIKDGQYNCHPRPHASSAGGPVKTLRLRSSGISSATSLALPDAINDVDAWTFARSR